MRNVLVIKLGALGDVVMATPLVDAIQRFHDGAKIHVLTTPAFVSLFGHSPDINITSFPRHGWLNNGQIIRWIRRGAFDRIYDLQSSNRTALWCALSGAPDRVGNHNRYPYTHHPPTRWHGQCHIFERMLEVLRAGGISDVSRQPFLPYKSAEENRIKQWLAEHGCERNQFVLLHAGASAKRPDKIWPHFDRLALALANRGLEVIWIGGESDRERNIRLAALTGINATAEFGIIDLAILGRHARFAITNDSGPMHALSASGIPVFGLFGPSDWRRNHALGQADRAIACVHYARGFEGKPQADCLALLSPDDVLTKLADEGLV